MTKPPKGNRMKPSDVLAGILEDLPKYLAALHDVLLTYRAKVHAEKFAALAQGGLAFHQYADSAESRASIDAVAQRAFDAARVELGHITG